MTAAIAGSFAQKNHWNAKKVKKGESKFLKIKKSNLLYTVCYEVSYNLDLQLIWRLSKNAESYINAKVFVFIHPLLFITMYLFYTFNQ